MAHKRQADNIRISRERYHAHSALKPVALLRADGKARALSAGRAIGPPLDVSLTA